MENECLSKNAIPSIQDEIKNEAEKKEKTPRFPAICENSTGADRTGVSRTGILFFWRLCEKNQ